MKNFIIFLIVYTVICKCSCTSIQSELQIANDSNTTTEQKSMEHSSLISRMKESIDSEYPQVIIYIPNNEDPLEVKQSPLKHIRNLLLSFFDRLIKKEIDFDDDYSLLKEVKRLNKVEVTPQNETDEETSNIPKNDILQFFSNFENTLDENDVMEEVPNKCISCQNTKPYNNNHSCKRMSTTNAAEKKLENLDDSKKAPLNLTAQILPGLIINGKNLIATPETKKLVKREKLVPKNGTATFRKKLKRQSRKKAIRPTERFVTEFIDKNTKYFVGETNESNQDSTTNKFDDGRNKSKKPSTEEQKPAIKAEREDSVLQSGKTVNLSAKPNSTNKFLETHHFLLNSGGTANKSATASIVKDDSNLKFNSIREILSNIKTKRDLSLSRSKRNSNGIKTSVESRDELPKVDEDRHPRVAFIKRTTAKKLEKRSNPPVSSTAVPSSAVPSSAVPSSAVPSSAVPSTAVPSKTTNTEKSTVSSTKPVNEEDSSVEPEFDVSDQGRSISQKPLLMIITVPTFLGIGAIILLLCFVTRDGGWCCKLFNIQYYKDPEANNYIAFR